MNRRFFSLAPHAVLVALVAILSVAHATPAKSNTVVIITDDQGYGDVGLHGNPVLEMPHLDALARAGAAWPHFYTSTVCSPTRASLMTGAIQLSHSRSRYVQGAVDDGSGGNHPARGAARGGLHDRDFRQVV